MREDFQLVGKTITGVIATPGKAGIPGKIWMLQFSDGSHVEFVSPTARRRLLRAGSTRKPVEKTAAKQAQMIMNSA